MCVPRGIVVHEDHVIERVRWKGGEDILWQPFINGFPTPEGHEQTFIGRIASAAVLDIAIGSSIEGQNRIRNILIVLFLHCDARARVKAMKPIHSKDVESE